MRAGYRRRQDAASYSTEGWSETDLEAATKELLDQGEAFLAYDLARRALERYPESLRLKQHAALALLRTGATEEARALLEPLCTGFQLSEETLRRSYEALGQVFTAGQQTAGSPSPQALDSLATFLREASRTSAALQQDPIRDEETLGLLASAYKDIWKHSGSDADARRCRDTYLRAFRETGGYYTGINAATMSWLIGDLDLATELARLTLAACASRQDAASQEDYYWVTATIGEAELLLGNPSEAIAAYRDAAAIAGRKYANIVSSLQQMRLMQAHHFPVPTEIFEILRPPSVVAFVGHMIDRPDRAEPRFPAYLEDLTRREIDIQLDTLDARIGYCSAACGADILFIEAMQEREAEVNIVLPFHEEDFIRTCVSCAGPRWAPRYRRAIMLADSVRYVTRERYLGDEVLFSFGSHVFCAYADLRARTLETAPFLLTAWNRKPSQLIGGTGDTVARWPDQSRLHIVPMDELLTTTPVPVDFPAPPVVTESDEVRPQRPYSRTIKTMLFADVVGYSNLSEEHVPYYMYEFLEKIAGQLNSVQREPLFINTWGDAIFVVMTDVLSMARYALALQDAVCSTNWAELGLPSEMSIRIALHAGPVFNGIDPITRRENFYGSHVNRAARIEPVTVPGRVYASEQFAALLNTERVSAEHRARQAGEPYDFPFAIDYIGVLSLAKDYGSQAIYSLRLR